MPSRRFRESCERGGIVGLRTLSCGNELFPFLRVSSTAGLLGGTTMPMISWFEDTPGSLLFESTGDFFLRECEKPSNVTRDPSAERYSQRSTQQFSEVNQQGTGQIWNRLVRPGPCSNGRKTHVTAYRDGDEHNDPTALPDQALLFVCTCILRDHRRATLPSRECPFGFDAGLRCFRRQSYSRRDCC